MERPDPELVLLAPSRDEGVQECDEALGVDMGHGGHHHGRGGVPPRIHAAPASLLHTPTAALHALYTLDTDTATATAASVRGVR